MEWAHSGWNPVHREYLRRAGCRIKVFHPLPWHLWSPGFSHEVSGKLSRFFTAFSRINKRNHRKVCIIDDRVAYVGSMNVTADHSEFYSGDKAWRDTALRIEGPEVRKLIYAFERLWYKREVSRKNWRRHKDEHYYRPRFNIVRTNDSILRRSFYLRDLIYRMNNAQEKIWITTPYFIPGRKYVLSLIHAAKRGVDVRILLGKKSDVFLFKWLHVIFYGKLLKAGVRIFEYQPTVIHAKNILIDQWSVIGSSNFNSRSFIHDLEVDVVVTLKENIQKIIEQYQNDFSCSQEVTLKIYRKISPIRKILGKLLLLLRYWF
jgi:cardiolipin synthase